MSNSIGAAYLPLHESIDLDMNRTDAQDQGFRDHRVRRIRPSIGRMRGATQIWLMTVPPLSATAFNFMAYRRRNYLGISEEADCPESGLRLVLQQSMAISEGTKEQMRDTKIESRSQWVLNGISLHRIAACMALKNH